VENLEICSVVYRILSLRPCQLPLKVSNARSVAIETYSGIARFSCDSMAFLFCYCACVASWYCMYRVCKHLPTGTSVWIHTHQSGTVPGWVMSPVFVTSNLSSLTSNYPKWVKKYLLTFSGSIGKCVCYIASLHGIYIYGFVSTYLGGHLFEYTQPIGDWPRLATVPSFRRVGTESPVGYT